MAEPKKLYNLKEKKFSQLCPKINLSEKIKNQIEATIRLQKLENEYKEEMLKRNLSSNQRSQLKKTKPLLSLIPENSSEIPSSDSSQLEKCPSSPILSQKNSTIHNKSQIETEPTDFSSRIVETEPRQPNNQQLLKKSLKKQTFSSIFQDRLESQKTLSRSPPICLNDSKNLFVHIVGNLPPIFNPDGNKKYYSKSPDQRIKKASLLDNAPKSHLSYHVFRNLENRERSLVRDESRAKNYSENIKSYHSVKTDINLMLEVEARKLKRIRNMKIFDRKKLSFYQ